MDRICPTGINKNWLAQLERCNNPNHQTADKRGGGQRQDPGPDNLPRYAPANRADSSRGPDSHDRSCHDVCGGYWSASPGCSLHHQRGRRLRNEAIRWGHFDKTHAKGLDDPFTANECSDADRQRTCDLDPKRDLSCRDQASNVQCQRDNPHRFLRIIQTMRQRHKA